MGKLVAIGGYDKKELIEETESINKEIIRLTRKKQPRILFLPTASEDSERYIRVFLNEFDKKLKCTTDLLLLYKRKLTFKQIKEKIFAADAIYIGGGNTLKMMNLWRKLKVDELLKMAYSKGIVLSGVSAGSICLFQAGVSDSRQFKNPKSNQYIKVNGLGIIPALNCPHYKSTISDRGHRTRGLKAISARTPGVCIAVEDGAAFVVVGNKYRVMNSVKNRKAYRTFFKNGKFFEKPILPTKKLESLKKLLK